MRTILTIRRLARGHRQELLHQKQVEVEQQGSVKEKKMTSPALSIARAFHICDGQIRVAPDLDTLGNEPLQRFAIGLHNE